MANAEPKTVTKTAKSTSMFEGADRPIMPLREYRLSGLENLWYYLSVLMSLGFWYTVKVVVKKAMSERHDN